MSTPDHTDGSQPAGPGPQAPDAITDTTDTDRRTEPASPVPPPGEGGGAHAAPRPTPPSGREHPDVVVNDLRSGRPDDVREGTRDRAGAPTASAPGGVHGTSGTHGTDTTPEVAARDSRRADERSVAADEPPSKPGFGRHVLGVVLGLLLTPFAFLLTGIGGARLADIAGTNRMGTDTLGVVLLALGIVLLVLLVLLGAWSPAVPITGGLVWGLALGIASLVAPRDVEATVQDLGGANLPAAVDQFTEAAMSGLLVTVGGLLLAAGLATAFARRAGRRYGVALTEHRHATDRGTAV